MGNTFWREKFRGTVTNFKIDFTWGTTLVVTFLLSVRTFFLGSEHIFLGLEHSFFYSFGPHNGEL